MILTSLRASVLYPAISPVVDLTLLYAFQEVTDGLASAKKIQILDIVRRSLEATRAMVVL